MKSREIAIESRHRDRDDRELEIEKEREEKDMGEPRNVSKLREMSC